MTRVGPPPVTRSRCTTSGSRESSRTRAARCGSARSTPASCAWIATAACSRRSATTPATRPRSAATTCGRCSRTDRAASGSARPTASRCSIVSRASSRTIGTTRTTTRRCAIRSSCRCIKTPPGLVWVGTRTGGVSRWNPRSWELGGHRPTWLENQPDHGVRGRAGQRSLDRVARGGLVRFDAATGTVDADRCARRPAERGRRSARDVAAAGPPRRAVDRHDGQRAQGAHARRAASNRFPCSPAIRAR